MQENTGAHADRVEKFTYVKDFAFKCHQRVKNKVQFKDKNTDFALYHKCFTASAVGVKNPSFVCNILCCLMDLKAAETLS